MNSTSDDLTAERIRNAREDEAQRAADLPAFIRHAEAIGSDFTLKVHTAAQLRAVLVTIGGHNNFDPVRAADLLGPLVADMMEVEVRQWVSGPALYLTVPPWNHQRLGERHYWRGVGDAYTWEQRQATAARVIAAGRELQADEISVDQFGTMTADGTPARVWNAPGERPYTVRLWWD